VNDPKLSWKAKGIFCYLVSKPDDWRFSMDEIIKNATDQMGALKSGCKELEQTGYLERCRMFGDDRKFIGWEWILKLPSKNRQTENPSVGNPIWRETALYTNTDLTNTDLTNTEYTNTSSADALDILAVWNEVNDCNLRLTDSKRKDVSRRLKTFSKEEIIEAIRKRKNSEAMQRNAGQYLASWESFFRSDDRVEKYLNLKEAPVLKSTSINERPF